MTTHKTLQREPTIAMLRVDVPNGAADGLCSGCLLGDVWRAMWDVAPVVQDAPPPRIATAAVRNRASGLIYSLPRPCRHHHIVHVMKSRGEDNTFTANEQGFLTNDGRFLNREDAMRVAIAAGQLLPSTPKRSQLFTEDLWLGASVADAPPPDAGGTRIQDFEPMRPWGTKLTPQEDAPLPLIERLRAPGYNAVMDEAAAALAEKDAEIAKLRDALRDEVLYRVCHFTVDEGAKVVESECKLCGGVWTPVEDEHHGPRCLAALGSEKGATE